MGSEGHEVGTKGTRGIWAVIQQVPAPPVDISRPQEAAGRWRLRGSVSLGSKGGDPKLPEQRTWRF